MMLKSALKTEDIAWAIIDVMADSLDTALLDVESFRVRNPLTLAAPQAIKFGFDAMLLTLKPENFPRVAVLDQPSPAMERSDGQSFAEGDQNFTIEWVIFVPVRDNVLLSDLTEEANLYALRYGESILKLLRENGPYAGFNPTTIKPAHEPAQASPWYADVNDGSSLTGFLAGGAFNVTMNGGYTR